MPNGCVHRLCCAPAPIARHHLPPPHHTFHHPIVPTMAYNCARASHLSHSISCSLVPCPYLPYEPVPHHSQPTPSTSHASPFPRLTRHTASAGLHCPAQPCPISRLPYKPVPLPPVSPVTQHQLVFIVLPSADHAAQLVQVQGQCILGSPLLRLGRGRREEGGVIVCS